MSSKILYDSRNNQIVRCQPEPKGSAGMPSFQGLCMSTRIPENQKEYMKTCIIEGEVLTNQAIKELRIINGEAIKKPNINITTDKQEVSISTNPQFTINIEIINAIESDNFELVQMLINDVNFNISVSNNIGSKTIELSEPDDYIISCIDDSFISQQVEVIAVE